MKWLDQTLWKCRYQFGLCLTEKEFHRSLKSMRIPTTQWPRWVSENADATTHFFEHPDGGKAAIVCMGENEHLNGVQKACLLVHEAVHIWQEHRVAVGEHKPSDESEAYAVQSISQRLMEAYSEAIK